jgi:transcriptional regulator with XRE-family HTH domain
MTSSNWQTEDAALLQKLRTDKRLDEHAFARMTSASIAQITQLENGGLSAFHSPILKYQLGRKLLRLLGADTTEELARSATRTDLADHSTVAPVISTVDKNFALTTFDKIAAQSKRDLNPSPFLEAMRSVKTFWVNHVVVSRVVLVLIFLFLMSTFFRPQLKQLTQWL